MMLDRVKSFHADDNPFESMSEENAEPFMFRTWSVASQSSYSRQGSAPLPAIPDAHARHSSAPIPGELTSQRLSHNAQFPVCAESTP